MKTKILLSILMILASAVLVFASPFSDVPENHWSIDAINSLTSKGIINGYEDGTFGGKRVVSRYHLAVVLSRMLASVEQKPDKISRSDLKVIERLTIEFADELYAKINAANIRVDIDDRDESVGKKIRNAAKEWIPYIFVVGDNEVESGKFQVTVRETGEKVDMTVDELISEINAKCEGKPFRRLPLPKDISRRINFQ